MSDERPFVEEDGAEAAPEIRDAADPQHTRRIRDVARRERAEAEAFWAGVFDSEVGRREMWAILDSAGAFNQRFAVASPTGFPDQMATLMLAGEQRFGFRLYLSWMRLCAAGVATMLTEHHPDLRPPSPPQRRSRAS